MSNKKQSSIEWLVNVVQSCIAPDYIPIEIVKQAKAMHKAETTQFAVDWFQNCPIGGDVNSTEDATQYYKETFA